jgi:hypothetical protein
MGRTVGGQRYYSQESGKVLAGQGRYLSDMDNRSGWTKGSLTRNMGGQSGNSGKGLRSIYTIRQIVLYVKICTDRTNPSFVARHFQMSYNTSFTNTYLSDCVNTLLAGQVRG